MHKMTRAVTLLLCGGLDCLYVPALRWADASSVDARTWQQVTLRSNVTTRHEYQLRSCCTFRLSVSYTNLATMRLPVWHGGGGVNGTHWIAQRGGCLPPHCSSDERKIKNTSSSVYTNKLKFFMKGIIVRLISFRDFAALRWRKDSKQSQSKFKPIIFYGDLFTTEVCNTNKQISLSGNAFDLDSGVPGLNLSLDTGYSEWKFSWFSSVSPS
jgi:hypothetical protein